MVKKIDLTDLDSPDPKIRYACTRSLLAAAKDIPEEIYSDLDKFIKLLDSDNNIIRWTGITVIGSLARVDKAGKIDRYIARLVGFLNIGNMITANNAIKALASIAAAKPEYRDLVTAELLKVENYRYDTEECGRITAGKVIEGISSYFGEVNDKVKVIEFAERQAMSSRNATRKKAEQFLKKYREN